MRKQLEVFHGWLAANRDDTSAYTALLALTRESLKRADSDDPSQREFDAQDLALAAERDEASDFDASKRWLENSKLKTFTDARRNAIEDYFRACGQAGAIRLVKRSPRGKHRAVWYLEAYDLPDVSREPQDGQLVPGSGQSSSAETIQYEFTPPGKVRPAWYVRPLIGAGSFVTRSWRGLVWLMVVMVPIVCMLLGAVATWGYTRVQRPLQTSDLASLFLFGASAWVLWRFFVRPTVWLLDDRIILASESWVAWSEEISQLELTKDEEEKRRLQLVRYSAVCPVCAGTIELRYSQGPNRRRLVGCCNEAPHDHVFSFDRILRTGFRLAEQGRSGGVPPEAGRS
jgi:hypothetical protein